MSRGLLALIALVSVLLAAPSASAALPAAKPPTAKALRGTGVTVSWPLKQPETTLEAGAPLRVVIRKVRGAARVKRTSVSLVQVTPSGAAIKRVFTQPGRGTTLYAVPGAAVARTFALRLDVGAAKYRSWIRVPAVPTAPASSPTPPFVPVLPGPTPPQPCSPTGAVAPAVTATPAAGAVATQFSLVTSVPAGAFLAKGIGYTWEREAAGGGWERVPGTSGVATPLIGVCVTPGTPLTYSGTVDLALTPGAYRIALEIQADPAWHRISTPFTVIP